jgi:hypothetical protein
MTRLERAYAEAAASQAANMELAAAAWADMEAALHANDFEAYYRISETFRRLMALEDE